VNWLVLLAGGRGERFWPLSRRSTPKQFLRLISDRTLLQETRERVGPLVADQRVVVVTGAEYAELVARQLPTVDPANILGEPAGRGTAASVAWAAAHIARQDPAAVLAVLPSDHVVRDAETFRRQLTAAWDHAAAHQQMTLFGIVPDRPDTGFGYIETGSKVGTGAHAVIRFVEKPDQARARDMVASGRFWWNSGMFVLPLRPLQEAFATLLPEVWAAAEALEAGAGPDAFLALPSVTLDVGVMERWGDRLAALPLDVGWDDVGTFQAVARLLAGRPPLRTVLERCEDVVVVGDDGPLVTGIGLKDLVIVRTPDAILILPPHEAQAVRTVLRRVGEEEGPAWL
jgi:mannose-1-phosphate guanylyltransferase/mannose-6-phosphate isomerase